jgi:hypothetical protein
MKLAHFPTRLPSERILYTRQLSKVSGPLDHHSGY